jgi:DinB family protein
LRGTDVLEMQLNGSFSGLRERLDTVTEGEWITRGIPGTSLLGFTLWHAARTIDWAVHCAIQGLPEIADGPQWGFLGAAEFAYGAGITDAEADRVARSVSRDQVRTYLDALQPAALGWLKQQTDSDLDRTPAFEVHQRAKPRYLTEPVWAEVSNLVGLPAWQILARPCVSHLRVHAGQIDILVQALRAKTPAT